MSSHSLNNSQRPHDFFENFLHKKLSTTLGVEELKVMIEL